VLIVFLDILETIYKIRVQVVIQKLNIAVIALVLIHGMNVTNQLQIWIQKEHAQTATLKMDGKRTPKPDSVNVLIM
jgi:bifunctional DNase/RNase